MQAVAGAEAGADAGVANGGGIAAVRALKASPQANGNASTEAEPAPRPDSGGGIRRAKSSAAGGGDGRPRSQGGDGRRQHDGRVTLKDFDVVGTLGKGGFGKVLLVTHRDSEMNYAMKVMSKETIVTSSNVDQVCSGRPRYIIFSI